MRRSHKLALQQLRRGRRAEGAHAPDEQTSAVALVAAAEPGPVQSAWLAQDEEEPKPAAENGAGTSEESETEGSHSLDDALGLYLRQMGAIPLLTREQELNLARRLDRMRSRYRHAALCSWKLLAQVAETFERIRAGQLALDPMIDVINSVGLSREEILSRLPYNLRTLRKLLKVAADDFRVLLRTGTTAARARLRRSLWRHLRKAVHLAEELSPRMELLERWVAELHQDANAMTDLAKRIDAGGRSAADRERRTRQVKQLRDLMLQVQGTPEELGRLGRVLRRREKLYHRAR